MSTTAVPEFQPSGYFRIEKSDRWWMVTPEGKPFLHFGLNHVEPGFLNHPYNAEHWQKKFECGYNHDHPQFQKKFIEKVKSDMALLGMNSLGSHNYYLPELAWGFPYVKTVRFLDICHWQTPGPEHFLDVFDPSFKMLCAEIAESKAGPVKTDPFLIGYSFTDCPIYTDLDAAERPVVNYGNARKALPTWPRVLRNKGKDSAGKQAYVQFIRERYPAGIFEFNGVYRTAFQSFDELLQAENWKPLVDPTNPKEQYDNLAFLCLTIDRYYKTAVSAIRSVDPNHLIYGDILNMNTGVPDEIVKTVARHTDLLTYQCYSYYDFQKPVLDRWHELTGKPLLNSDSNFSEPNENMPVPLGPYCRDQEHRAQCFLNYAEKAFQRPDFLGWNWCGWMDRWIEVQPGRQHSGLQDPFGNIYEPMQKAMKDFSERMIDVAISGRAKTGS